jgi:hypothetical protein
MTPENAHLWLIASLKGRPIPEAVAEHVVSLLRPLPVSLLWRLNRTLQANSMLKRWGWSAMPSTFRPPDTMGRQVGKARELAGLFLKQDMDGATSPDDIAKFISLFSAAIGKAEGQSDFRHHRLDRAGRKALGLSRPTLCEAVPSGTADGSQISAHGRCHSPGRADADFQIAVGDVYRC